jgi:hypothetical protein
MAKILTAKAIEKLKPASHRREVPDAGCKGLYLTIQSTGTKTWAWRYHRPNGKSAKLALGPVDLSGKETPGKELRIGQPLTLAAARALCVEQERIRLDGRDPGVEHFARQAKLKTAVQSADDASYPAMARRYVERYAKPNTRRWKHTARMLGLDPNNDAFPVISDSIADRWSGRAAAAISRTDVVAEIDRAVDQGRGPTAGNHLLAALRAMYRWHMRRGSLESSPCAMVEMPVPHKNLRRSHRLSDDEIRWMWKALDDSPPVYAALLRFLLLTATRRDEARLMVDTELSADGMAWVVPSARAKNHLDHLVGLSKQAREQLALAREKRANGKAGYVFTLDGEHPLGGMSKWKTRLDRRMLEIAREERGEDAKVEEWQIHDFRRCARSFLSRVTSPDVAERVLGHVVGGVRAHYDVHEYADEKRKALALWAREVERIISGKMATLHVLSRAGR